MDYMTTVKEILENYDARIPSNTDRVYKDECLYSFDSPDCENGLFICLKTFYGLGLDFVDRYYRKTGNSVFLHMLRTKIKVETKMTQVGEAPTQRKITRLAIGVEGGFDPDAENKQYKTVEKYSIVILPSFERIPFETSELPQKVIDSVKGIIEAKSVNYLDELESMSNTWDGEVRIKTKYADIEQLNNGKKIAPCGWKCEFENCDKDNNLWLNLTDGSIYCGRKFFDGSGGNGHAIIHYNNTKYPLAVKLGTITKDGKGDVYSYPEDDMVENPNLIKHLSHFGINISTLEKTEKSMIELELDLNKKVGDWATMQEIGSELKPVFGPGYTGIHNLGNSCYMNSVLQVLFSIPDFTQKYYERNILQSCPDDPNKNFDVQMAKIAHGLCSGKYSIPPTEVIEGKKKYWHHGIRPNSLKMLIGQSNPEFASKNQQDAQEFFLYLLSLVERHSQSSENPADCFKFKIEERYQCLTTGQVKYTTRPEYCLPLSIPLEDVINKEEVAAWQQRKEETNNSEVIEVVRPRISILSCLSAFEQPEIIEQFFNSELLQRTTAQKTTRIATFPDFLVVHLKKFTLREDWVPIKLDVAVEMPQTLDITYLRANGPQDDENLLPDSADAPIPPPFEFNENLMSELTQMGFPPEACKRALFFTKNQGLNDASNWLMEHISDSDFSEPFVPPGAESNSAAALIMSMGFESSHVIAALKATDNNVERAIDWVMSHGPEPEVNSCLDIANERDGKGRYELVAFISHMGTSSMVGHYVCHIKKKGCWVIYNDEKVAVSKNPPFDLGYLYIYKRKEF
ncbi:Hypothetical protein CINCED_3A020265 [Cinara cedri]|uniref:Ubiquitin carboxyl-terminal hydrolase n=1 Tax=Cinara cedri TaxID=506608 RepID=A0A5E4NAM4_9HEMI|nr:Hypothetical protein CINCED_3A020265 [Cinara cedri]